MAETIRHDTVEIGSGHVNIKTFKGNVSGYVTFIEFSDDDEPMMRSTRTEDEANAAHDEGLRLALEAKIRVEQ